MASGKPLSAEMQHQLALLEGRIEGGWRLVQDEGRRETTPQKLKDAIDATDKVYITEFFTLRNHVIEELSAGRPANVDPALWLRLTNESRASIDEVATTAFDLASQHATKQLAAAQRDLYAAIALMCLFLGVGGLTILYVIKGVAWPITRIAETMRIVADGDLSCPIPFADRSDEIGWLSRALLVFRDNAIEKQQFYLAKVGAEMANRTKSEFLANMSHELRTPLNAILGFSEIIKIGMFGPVSERYRGYASDIFNSSAHLLRLINEILDLSKLEAGKFELHEEDVEISEIVQASIHLLEPQAEKAKIRLSKSVDNDLPLVRADDRRLRQVLINLLSNAVKFTPEGGRVCVSVTAKSGAVSIAISDTGIGIEQDEIPKALEAFRQTNSKISRKYEGTGLGLPLAKHLVERHGGTLTIESKINVGTTVMVALPRERSIPRTTKPEPAYVSA
jgi:signal transduction histidine kinase